MDNKINITSDFEKYIDDYLEIKRILNNAKKKGYVIEVQPDKWVLTEKGDKEWAKELGIE